VTVEGARKEELCCDGPPKENPSADCPLPDAFAPAAGAPKRAENGFEESVD
jgi:hypothetical protein